MTIKSTLHKVSLALVIILILPFLTPQVRAENAPPIDVAAAAAILADPVSGRILYEKNSTEKRYPASTTKILTALLTLEYLNLDDVVTMEEADFAGMGNGASNAGLKVGEKVKVKDMLYCLMLPSANEAANALARHISGSIPAFAELMNHRAEELGAKNTHFVNPNGLHDENHYSCAYDLYLFAREAMKNDTFRSVVNTAQITLSETNMQPKRKIYTTNLMILRRSDPSYYDPCVGIKTGSTTPAGACLVSAATKKGYTFISVVLGCEKKDGQIAQSFPETKKLFEWGFDNFKSKVLLELGETIAETKVRLAKDKDSVMLVTDEEITAIVPKDLEPEELVRTQNIPESVDAPVKSGQIIGELTISYQGEEYGKVNLVALTDVELSQVLYYKDKLDNFFQSDLFKYILLGIAAFILLYIAYMVLINRHRRKKFEKQMRSRGSRYRRY